jgi:hypothetical protein
MEDTMNRRQLLAAELHRYSYANYADHLGIGNIRFDELMPNDVDALERAEREGWDAPRLAHALEIPEKRLAEWLAVWEEAKDIVDAPNAGESFRRGVRYSVRHAVEDGLKDQDDIERLVTQICYRAADLAYLLDLEGKRLAHYSRDLRETTKADDEAMLAQFRDSIE